MAGAPRAAAAAAGGAADIPALPESLAALRENAAAYPRAARYYTSGLLRTEQTLAALYGPVPHVQLPGLREMDFGDFEMKSYQQLKDTPAYQAWIADVEHNPCPNGESAPQVLARNRAAMDRVLAAGEDARSIIRTTRAASGGRHRIMTSASTAARLAWTPAPI